MTRSPADWDRWSRRMAGSPATNAEVIAQVMVRHLGRKPTVQEAALVTVVLARFDIDPNDDYQPIEVS